MSAFGSTDIPTTSGADPIATANTFADWVIRYQMDGIDIDYEDLGAMDKGDGSAEVLFFLLLFDKKRHYEQRCSLGIFRTG